MPFNRTTSRFLLWVLMVCFCVWRVLAEQGFLVVVAKDLTDDPIPGIQIGTEGESNPLPFTDKYGRARITLAPQTKPNAWVKLKVFRSLGNLDLVIIFPTGGFASVPSFENETQNYVPVTVATRGDKAILEHAPGVAAIHAEINRSIAANSTNGGGAVRMPRPESNASAANMRLQLLLVALQLNRPTREESRTDDISNNVALADASKYFGLAPEEVEAAFQRWGGDTLTWKIVDLTGLLETGNTEPFVTVTGLGSLHDVFFGVAGWSLRVCTLQPLLLRFRAVDGPRFDSIMGADANRLIDILKAPCPASSKSAVGEMLDESGSLVEPWKTRLKILAQEPLFQRVQVDQLVPLVQRAKEKAAEFGLNSERAVAFFYDLIVQSGPVQASRLRNDYLKDTAAFAAIVGRQPDEIERLLMIANRNVENTNSRFGKDVRSRRLMIALGAGYVHGKEFDLDRLGIGLSNYITGEAIQVQNDPDLLEKLRKGWLPAQQTEPPRQSEEAARIQSQEHSVCGVALAKGIDSADTVSGKHLSPKSFDFILGDRGSPDYLHGRLIVTPGIRCVDGWIGFPLFGGVSKEKEFFNINTIEGNPASAKYLEQWLREIRIFFDNGVVLKSRDALLAGKLPTGANRIVRVEMDFDGGDKARATLTWSSE